MSKLFWFTVVALSAMPAFSDTLVGKVVGIADGDTVTLLAEDHHRIQIRISGIDAPEKRQPYGQTARKAMSDCAFGKLVTIEWKKVDRYGRTVGKLEANGIDCGLRQIELGQAWHYKSYAREQDLEDRRSYAAAENAAKLAQRGLWSDPNPLPPWEFRHLKPPTMKDLISVP